MNTTVNRKYVILERELLEKLGIEGHLKSCTYEAKEEHGRGQVRFITILTEDYK